MKKVFLSGLMLAALTFTGCKNEAKSETESVATEQTESSDNAELAAATFGVRGNCEMCKSTIEEAVHQLEGISKADWDVSKKQISVSFDASKTNLEAIHKAIADAGYDTDKLNGSTEAYDNLPECCQYDHAMEMSVQ
ncbi:heavy metal transporter [Flavobacterium sediminis]|uniref:Heavy metal transporter n=1 Tax=Flavobacterium sediminis TaxID=2201181 RepID=A0A2U8QX26_9FLAO|nr:cation transporter [Flavobacterium sediminis]AWM14609.1 heavy metal transporter [Flavobacterium sediminis]